jgi:copper resistance protein C
MPLTRRLFPLIIACCLALATSHGAKAHALVVESSPAADSSASGSALDIMLRFNSRLDHERSRLTLIAPDGTNHRLAVSNDSPPNMLKAKTSGLKPGAYKLRWQVLAIDGHITRGDIPFRVTQP